MFSSSNGLNPFQQYHFTSSSSYNPSPPLINNQEVEVVSDEIFLHHIHNHPDTTLSAPFFLYNNQIPDSNIINLSNAATKQPDISSLINEENFSSKKPAKKDRHSKIYTAHGLRDRRVRLSIDIAREFFDLQDMLGFDKASKTVEWLLNNSNDAITELAKTKLYNNNNNVNGETMSFSWTNSECTEAAVSTEMEADYNNILNNESDLQFPAKDSRVKTRARARERTKEKVFYTKRTCQQEYFSSSKNCTCSPQILNQFRTLRSRSDHMNVQDEDIVIKKKMKEGSGSSSKGECSCNNHIVDCSPDLPPQNWEMNSSSFNNSPSR